MNWLRELREEAVLPVRELSRQSGMSMSEDTVTKRENGHRKARPGTIRRLAKALNAQPRELLDQEIKAGYIGTPPSDTAPRETSEEPRIVSLSGTIAGSASLQARPTVTVSVPLTLRWEVAEALKNGKKPATDELSKLEEAARAGLTAE